MQTSNHYIPPGAGVLAPYLIVKDANAALEFYREAFGAVEVERLNTPDGRTMHAELKIGGAMLMLGEYPGVETPPAGGFPALSLYLYVPDVDSTVEKAARLGAEVIAQPQDKFYGNREAGLRDPAGLTWWVATCKEILTVDEIRARAAAAGRGA